MRIHKNLISYVRLDHTLYSINYGINDLNTGWVHEGDKDLNIIFERGKTAVCAWWCGE